MRVCERPGRREFKPRPGSGDLGEGRGPSGEPPAAHGLAAGDPASGGGHRGRGEGRKLHGWAGTPGGRWLVVLSLSSLPTASFPPTRAGFSPAFSAVLCSQRFIFFTFTVGGWSCLFPSSPPGLEGKARSPGGHPGWKALPWPGLAGAGGAGGWGGWGR